MEIWTVGYEKAALADVLRSLRYAGVECLVDVRELPQSRRAGFSKRMLQASVEELGIDYRHLKALGTPKEGRVAHHSGDQARFWAVYEKQLATSEAQQALDELTELAGRRRACLLCFEADWRHCHRARIVEVLGERAPVEAHHLLPEPAFL
ncbi:MAG TPA: DUF488 domain-containing protein [Stellaceae bacterium]|nr:DUF488 domain-containing protein [Stellaceae bacterium]